MQTEVMMTKAILPRKFEGIVEMVDAKLGMLSSAVAVYGAVQVRKLEDIGEMSSFCSSHYPAYPP